MEILSPDIHKVNHTSFHPTGYRCLPIGHRFFPDCERENNARFIEWGMTRKNIDAWFITQTFKEDQSPARAAADYKRWAGRLTQALFDRTGSDQLRWILTTEMQKRGVIHLHSLVMGKELSLLSRKRSEQRWQTQTMNTGFCRIYDADFKAAPYLAKYTSKSQGGELIWGGYWRGLKTPASAACGHSTPIR